MLASSHSALQSIRPYLEAVLNFFYPPFCFLCEGRVTSAQRMICADCWRRLPRIGSAEQEAQPESGEGKPVFECRLAVWAFDEQVQKLIHEFKYLKATVLADSIGDAMAELVRVTAAFSGADLVIPVPLHKTKLRERGFNQSQLLAEKIGERLGIKIGDAVISRIRNTSSQAKLNATEREQNMRGAFRLNDPHAVVSRAVILVDDVYTTGATLSACAQTLVGGNPTRILALTAARTL